MMKDLLSRWLAGTVGVGPTRKRSKRFMLPLHHVPIKQTNKQTNSLVTNFAEGKRIELPSPF